MVNFGKKCAKKYLFFEVFLSDFWQFLRGLTSRHNSKRSYTFSWETLVVWGLLFPARHKCSTPPKYTWFWKYGI